MLENIRLSFQGIWAHKMRSFLTMLGIIIGIAAIIAIVSTIKGTNERIKENLVGSGNTVVNITLSQGEWGYSSGESGAAGIPVIDQSIKDRILEVPEVIDLATYRLGRMYNQVCTVDESIEYASIYGVDSKYFDVMGYTVKSGRFFSDTDRKKINKVVIIDTTCASAMFEGGSAVGKTLEIGKDSYTIIGIVEQLDSFSPVIEEMRDWFTYYGDDAGGKIFVVDRAWPLMFGFDEPYNVVVKPRTTDDITAAGRKSTDILNEFIKANSSSNNNALSGEEASAEESSFKYKSNDLLEKAKSLQEVSASTNQQLIWIASISLIVGGIGVMNIMLVSVTERTREIGLKKALGARKIVILGQFLTEAAVLTSLGGIIGVGAGIGLAYVISSVAAVPVAISGVAIAISVAFSVVIGIVFGLIPSIKASNLNPIDALRYE